MPWRKLDVMAPTEVIEEDVDPELSMPLSYAVMAPVDVTTAAPEVAWLKMPWYPDVMEPAEVTDADAPLLEMPSLPLKALVVMLPTETTVAAPELASL